MASLRISAGISAVFPSYLFIIVFTLLTSSPVASDPYELPVQTVIAPAWIEEPEIVAGRTVLTSEALESVGVATLDEAISFLRA